MGFLNLLFAPTPSDCKGASAPPRLCPQTVREFTCLLPKIVASDAVTDGPLAPPIANDLYISVKPSSVSPAPARNGRAVVKKWTPPNHAWTASVPRRAMTASPVPACQRRSPIETVPVVPGGLLSVARSFAKIDAMTSKVVLFVPSPAFTGCPARLPRSLGGTSYAPFTTCPYRMPLFRSMPLNLSHESAIGRRSGSLDSRMPEGQRIRIKEISNCATIIGSIAPGVNWLRVKTLTPSLQFWPERGKRPEFCATANKDGNLAFQRVGIVRGLARVFDVLEQALQDFTLIIQNDQAIPRIPSRSPQEIRLVPAERRWQTIAPPQEIDGAGLPVVLREDAAARPLFGREPAVSLIHCHDHLLPSELIGEVLWKNRAHVAVLAARDFEWQLLHVGNELLHGENRHDNRSKPGPARGSCQNKRGFQPGLTRPINETLDHPAASRHIDRIDWPEIVILAFKNHEYRERGQIAPAQEPVRLQPRRKKKREQAGNPDRRKEWLDDEHLLAEKRPGRKHHVAAFGLDVAHEFHEGPVMLNIPQ